jgi:hypothetical protein
VWWGYATLDELVGAYLAAKALWLPSNARSEAFGLVQIEAMACGCPVINTAIPHSGVAWVSKHGKTGFTVPVEHPAAFAAAANQLLGHPELREMLACGARRRATDLFSDQTMAVRTLDLYSKIIARAQEAARIAGRYLAAPEPAVEVTSPNRPPRLPLPSGVRSDRTEAFTAFTVTESESVLEGQQTH